MKQVTPGNNNLITSGGVYNYFNAITRHILPNSSLTKDLGSSKLFWRTLFVKNIQVPFDDSFLLNVNANI
jgi:hypothetical protein